MFKTVDIINPLRLRHPLTGGPVSSRTVPTLSIVIVISPLEYSKTFYFPGVAHEVHLGGGQESAQI